jgi:tetratricopeptide (TPR) repeat protein
VYYNRGLDDLAEGRYADALAANLDALRLDPGFGPAECNLLATVNNWAVSRYRDGDLAAAADLVERGLAVDPRHDELRANRAWFRAKE